MVSIAPKETQDLNQMEDEAFWSAPCGESAAGVMEQVRQYVDAHFIEDLSLGDLGATFPGVPRVALTATAT